MMRWTELLTNTLRCLIVAHLAAHAALATPPLVDVVQRVQPKMVKIFGAGGLEGLEAYQSGFFISPEGLIVTSWSYVLDTSQIVVVLHDGRRFVAEMVDIDPRLDIALLQIPIQNADAFDLQQAVELDVGQRVLAFSNLYGIAAGSEPSSVLHGVVSAIPELSARRGVFPSPYQGRVYVVDAVTNNVGAAGGALTSTSGQLVGLLGKQLRSTLDNTWLNYAIPGRELADSVAAIRSGTVGSTAHRTDRVTAQLPVTLRDLGLILVPNVLAKTPPFIEVLLPGGPAARAGLQVDDLLVMVDGQSVQSQNDLREILSYFELGSVVRLVVMRGQQLVDVSVTTRE